MAFQDAPAVPALHRHPDQKAAVGGGRRDVAEVFPVGAFAIEGQAAALELLIHQQFAGCAA
ncbi:hypothetical protein D3C71_1866480 [compost metagenome]